MKKIDCVAYTRGISDVVSLARLADEAEKLVNDASGRSEITQQLQEHQG